MRRLFLFILSGLLFCAAPLFAQTEECSVDNLDACTVNLTMFCLREGEVPFSFGINDDFDLEFSVTFSGEPPATNLPLFLVNGEVENGSTDEPKVTNLRCRGSRCTSAITLEEINELEDKFDFDQNFFNIVLRLRGKNGKDICVSKFTNNPELLEQNSRSKQVICSLEPTAGNESVSGAGHFKAAGYGSDGDAEFHLKVWGFEAGTTYKACNRLGEDRYRRAFSFTPSTLGTATDSQIYGLLTPLEQAEFNERPSDYSYDLYREIFGSGDPVDALFAPSLSLINKGVSKEAAGNSIRESNRSSRVKRRARKRNRKSKGKRVRSASIAGDLPDQVSTQAIEQRVLGFLGFDPQGDQIQIFSKNCIKAVEGDAIATLVCGPAAEDGDRSCKAMTSSDDDVSGTVCAESTSGVGKLTIRLKGFAVGDYTICLDGSVIEAELVATDDSSSQKLTDNAILADGDPQFELISQTVSDVSVVGISSSGDCNDTVASVTF